MDQFNYELEQFQGGVIARIAQLLQKTAFQVQIQQSLKQYAKWLVHAESTRGID